MNPPEDLAQRQQLNLLYDFYGPMLTPKQAACFTLRYQDDCSLTEIAEELNISPQAVVDFIKRSAAKLTQCEEQLGLVQKFQQQKKLAEGVLKKLDELEESETVNWIRSAIEQITFM